MKVEWVRTIKRGDETYRVIRATGLTLETYRKLLNEGLSQEELMKRYPQLSPVHFEYLDNSLKLKE
jgi:hypothetical protein